MEELCSERLRKFQYVAPELLSFTVLDRGSLSGH